MGIGRIFVGSFYPRRLQGSAEHLHVHLDQSPKITNNLFEFEYAHFKTPSEA